MRTSNDWNILSEMDLDLGLLWFYEKLIEVCEAHTPERKAKGKNSGKIPFKRRKVWKRLQKLHKKLRVSKTQVKVTAVLLEIKALEKYLLEDTAEKDRKDEKEAIERWLLTSTRSPMTNATITKEGKLFKKFVYLQDYVR